MLVVLLLQRVFRLSASNHSNHVYNQAELEYVMQMLAPSPELLELIHDSDLGWTERFVTSCWVIEKCNTLYTTLFIALVWVR
jgi:hypothetical protein